MTQISRHSLARLKRAKIGEQLTKAGYEFETDEKIDAFKKIDFWLPSVNTAILNLSPSHFCFANKGLNAKGLMHLRLAYGHLAA